jgi:Holliday junction resolvase RusA-like endonuclease
MKRSYYIEVPAIPIAQPRPRAVIRGNHAGVAPAKKEHPIHAFKATVAMAYSAHQSKMATHDRAPHTGPVQITLKFLFPRTTAMTWKSRPMPRIKYTKKKNDFDNVAKAVCDALNGVAWVDDGQIYRAQVERWYCNGDEAPHVEMTIIMEDE